MQHIHWSPGITLEDIEKMVIIKAYSFFKKNKTATAESLKIAIRTLDAKLAKYEMEEQDARERSDAQERHRVEWLNKSRGISSGGGYPNPPSRFAPTGVHLESAPQPAAQSQVPVPERTEVQSVLPKSASKDHSSKSRK